MGRRPVLISSLVVPLAIAGFGIFAGATSASATNSSLQPFVLRPAQVGPGYMVKVIPGGDTVGGQVTLDMCGFRFASESRRSERLQTVYVRRRSKLFLSNEVVRYRPGGAAAAIREISTAVRTCPPRPMPSTLKGVPPLTYRIARLASANYGLLPGAIVMQVTVSGTFRGKRVSEKSFVVYQRRGDVLSGIYVYGGSIEARSATRHGTPNVCRERSQPRTGVTHTLPATCKRSVSRG